jgi:hypothetical protein
MNDLYAGHRGVTGSVECLGLTFPSNDARRAHFLQLLAEKLKDPAFRKVEGFPHGTDEAILAMSDPPYYTACPNPWLADFVHHYGTPYDPTTCQVAEHCWDPVGHAIVTYGYLFDGLIQARQREV